MKAAGLVSHIRPARPRRQPREGLRWDLLDRFPRRWRACAYDGPVVAVRRFSPANGAT